MVVDEVGILFGGRWPRNAGNTGSSYSVPTTAIVGRPFLAMLQMRASAASSASSDRYMPMPAPRASLAAIEAGPCHPGAYLLASSCPGAPWRASAPTTLVAGKTRAVTRSTVHGDVPLCFEPSSPRWHAARREAPRSPRPDDRPADNRRTGSPGSTCAGCGAYGLGGSGGVGGGAGHDDWRRSARTV